MNHLQKTQRANQQRQNGAPFKKKEDFEIAADDPKSSVASESKIDKSTEGEKNKSSPPPSSQPPSPLEINLDDVDDIRDGDTVGYDLSKAHSHKFYSFRYLKNYESE